MSKSAFPSPSINGEAGRRGMNLLEYYAGQALQSIFASERSCETLAILHESYKEISLSCFNVANYMVKEAEKRSQQKGDLK